MTLIPNDPIVCFYNGVTFPTETETVSIVGRPVYDRAGRTVVYVLYTITLKAIVGAANQEDQQPTDGALTTLRKRLTEPAGEFHYENVGFGNLTINVPAGGPNAGAEGFAKDVEWGPKPTLLQWKPQGQVAAEIVWTVEVRVPECDAAKYQIALMECNYRLEASIDASGYSRRVYSGFLRIPQTRAFVGDRALGDHADRWREQIIPPLLPGFRRIPGDFTLDESKCRLDWTITDQEVGPNYPPPGIVEVSMVHEVGRSGALAGTGGLQWQGNLSATYEVARNVPRSVAFGYFMAVLAHRLDLAAKAAQGAGYGATVILRGLILREPEVYGRRGAGFSATYTFMSSLKRIVAASGLWTTPPRSDWAAWSASLAKSAWSARGNAQLAFSVQSDSIIDLCAQEDFVLGGGGRLGGPAGPTLQGAPPAAKVDPQDNWLSWKNRVRVEPVNNTVEHKPLPAVPPIRVPDFPAGPPAGGGAPRTSRAAAFNAGQLPVGPGPARPSGAGASIIQTRVNPTYYAYLEGEALRAGGTITPPSLVAVGGQPATPANLRGNGFAQAEVANWFGVPIIYGRWRLRYLLSGPPNGVDLPGSPFGDLA